MSGSIPRYSPPPNTPSTFAHGPLKLTLSSSLYFTYPWNPSLQICHSGLWQRLVNTVFLAQTDSLEEKGQNLILPNGIIKDQISVYSHQFHHLTEHDCAIQVCITAAHNKQVKHCQLVACVHTVGNKNTKCTIIKFLNWRTFQEITYQDQKVLYSKDRTSLVVPVGAKKF